MNKITIGSQWAHKQKVVSVEVIGCGDYSQGHNWIALKYITDFLPNIKGCTYTINQNMFLEFFEPIVDYNKLWDDTINEKI